MFAWIYQNIATIIICAILIAIVISVTVHLIRNRKKGNPTCGCGCSNCPMSSSCCQKK